MLVIRGHLRITIAKGKSDICLFRRKLMLKEHPVKDVVCLFNNDLVS